MPKHHHTNRLLQKNIVDIDALGSNMKTFAYNIAFIQQFSETDTKVASILQSIENSGGSDELTPIIQEHFMKLLHNAIHDVIAHSRQGHIGISFSDYKHKVSENINSTFNQTQTKIKTMVEDAFKFTPEDHYLELESKLLSACISIPQQMSLTSLVSKVLELQQEKETNHLSFDDTFTDAPHTPHAIFTEDTEEYLNYCKALYPAQTKEWIDQLWNNKLETSKEVLNSLLEDLNNRGGEALFNLLLKEDAVHIISCDQLIKDICIKISEEENAPLWLRAAAYNAAQSESPPLTLHARQYEQPYVAATDTSSTDHEESSKKTTYNKMDIYRDIDQYPQLPTPVISGVNTSYALSADEYTPDITEQDDPNATWRDACGAGGAAAYEGEEYLLMFPKQ